MRQTSFLDMPPAPTPLARISDPITSHEAAESISGEAEEIAYDAAVVVANIHGNFTAMEMADRGSRIPGERGRCFDRETLRKRYTSLLAKGLIVLTKQTRKCLITGKNVQTFRLRKPTDADPLVSDASEVEASAADRTDAARAEGASGA